MDFRRTNRLQCKIQMTEHTEIFLNFKKGCTNKSNLNIIREIKFRLLYVDVRETSVERTILCKT